MDSAAHRRVLRRANHERRWRRELAASDDDIERALADQESDDLDEIAAGLAREEIEAL